MTRNDSAPDHESPAVTALTASALAASALLAGPRGRRLCLELASLAATAAGAEAGMASTTDCATSFNMAMFYAAYNLDPHKGTSTVLFGTGTAQPIPNPSAEEVAALLDGVALPVLTEAMALEALAMTVSVARYWQEPDGADVLAAAPALRRSLHRFAHQLTDSPLTKWWRTPMDAATQWSVDFVEDSHRTVMPAHEAALNNGAANTLTQWRLEIQAEEERAVRDGRTDPAANWSGTWWSRPPSTLPHSTRMMGAERGELGPVGLWLVEDGFGEDEAVLEALRPPVNARIFQITSPEDWARLCRERPLEVTASKRQDWYRTTGRNGKWLMPDWSSLKEKYDAVHLTTGGYLTAAGREITVDETYSSVLAGWDPDATYWLCDVTSDVDSRQTWLQDPDGLSWAPQGDRLRCRTVPERKEWNFHVHDYLVSAVTTRLGDGDEVWQRASRDVLSWKVKTRSGFRVDTPGPVVEGQRVNVTAAFLGVKVVEPVQVVSVADTADRVGFAYRTLPGHPVSGEEAFIVHRDGGGVYLTIRSLTRAAPQQPWRSLFPLLLRVQKLVRRRYLRALR